MAGDLLESDYYEMLGLDDKHATEEQITKSFKKHCLKFHPDKIGEDKMTPDLKEIWLRMSKGHETLLDPKRRMVYDSTLPFDDDLPT